MTETNPGIKEHKHTHTHTRNNKEIAKEDWFCKYHSTQTGLRARRSEFRIPAGATKFCVLQNVQTGSEDKTTLFQFV